MRHILLWALFLKSTCYLSSHLWFSFPQAQVFVLKKFVVGLLIGNCNFFLVNFQGTPSSARHIPILALFSPLFLLQGAGVIFTISRLVEKLVLLSRSGSFTGRYLTISSRTRDCFAFLHHGSRYQFHNYAVSLLSCIILLR